VGKIQHDAFLRRSDGGAVLSAQEARLMPRQAPDDGGGAFDAAVRSRSAGTTKRAIADAVIDHYDD
jgi:hypothetical protein